MEKSELIDILDKLTAGKIKNEKIIAILEKGILHHNEVICLNAIAVELQKISKMMEYKIKNEGKNEN